MKISAAIDLLISLISQAQRVSSLIAAARAEGRDSLSDDELDELAMENDQARFELQEVIDRAGAGDE